MSGMRRFERAASRFAGVAITLFVPAAFLVSSAGAASQLPSGDTCTASGVGNSYTLTIALPPNAAPQGAFAFGATGVKVTNINIAGEVGSLSTQNLPPNTTGEWLMASPPRPGESITAVLSTSGRVTGSFRVIAATSPPSGSYFKEFLCAVSHGSPVPSNLFTVNQHVSYDAAAGAWHLAVTVPGAGTVTGIQAVATAEEGSSSKQVAAKTSIETRKVVAKSAGTYTLSLRPNARGNAALEQHGSIKLEMTVAFNPKDGTSADKVLSLTLRK